MKTVSHVLLLMASMAFVLLGCSDNSAPIVAPNDQALSTPTSSATLEKGCVVAGSVVVNIGNPVPTNKWQYSVLAGDSAAYDGRLPFGDVIMWDKANYEVPGGASTLTNGFNRTQRITCALALRFPWDIRLSATGMFSSGFWYPENLKGGRTLSYAQAPWNRRIDLRLEKSFPVSGGVHVDLFVDVMNLCNWTNILAYCNISLADPAAWELRGDPTGGAPINRPVTPEGTLLYNIPREAYFGVRVGF